MQKIQGSQMELIIPAATIPPVTANLPSSVSTPVKIDVSGDKVAGVYIILAGDAWVTHADTDAIGLSNMAAKLALRQGAGTLVISVGQISSSYLYIRSQSSAVTDGVSYQLLEFAR